MHDIMMIIRSERVAVRVALATIIIATTTNYWLSGWLADNDEQELLKYLSMLALASTAY
jgi:hypothetical protein